MCLFFARSVFRENSGSDGVFFVEERESAKERERVQKREKERCLFFFVKVEKKEKNPQTARETNNPCHFFFFSSFFFPHTNKRNEREKDRFPTPLQKKRENQKRRAKGKRQRENASGSARRLFFPSASRFFSSFPPFSLKARAATGRRRLVFCARSKPPTNDNTSGAANKTNQKPKKQNNLTR